MPQFIAGARLLRAAESALAVMVVVVTVLPRTLAVPRPARICRTELTIAIAAYPLLQEIQRAVHARAYDRQLPGEGHLRDQNFLVARPDEWIDVEIIGRMKDWKQVLSIEHERGLVTIDQGDRTEKSVLKANHVVVLEVIAEPELHRLLVLVRLVVADLAVVALAERAIHLRSEQHQIRFVPTVRHLLIKILYIIGEHGSGCRDSDVRIGAPERVGRLRSIDTGDDVVGSRDPRHQIIDVDGGVLRSLVEQSSRELHQQAGDADLPLGLRQFHYSGWTRIDNQIGERDRHALVIEAPELVRGLYGVDDLGLQDLVTVIRPTRHFFLRHEWIY